MAPNRKEGNSSPFIGGEGSSNEQQARGYETTRADGTTGEAQRPRAGQAVTEITAGQNANQTRTGRQSRGERHFALGEAAA